MSEGCTTNINASAWSFHMLWDVGFLLSTIIAPAAICWFRKHFYCISKPRLSAGQLHLISDQCQRLYLVYTTHLMYKPARYEIATSHGILLIAKSIFRCGFSPRLGMQNHQPPPYHAAKNKHPACFGIWLDGVDSGVEIRDTKVQRFFRNWWLSFFLYFPHTHTSIFANPSFQVASCVFSDFQGGINTDGDGLLQVTWLWTWHWIALHVWSLTIRWVRFVTSCRIHVPFFYLYTYMHMYLPTFAIIINQL